MACFIVPMTEAVITTIASKVIAKKEISNENTAEIKFSDKIANLNKMLWGGSALLAFEHLWHGEISPFFPFLTALSDPENTSVMLHEMATSGTAMAGLVTLVWAVMTAFSFWLQKKNKISENALGGVG